MKIEQMNPDTVEGLRYRLSLVLVEFGKAQGLKVELGRCRFSSTYARFELSASVIGENGVAETKQRVDYKRYAKSLGLDPDWLDKSFRYQASEFTIVGLEPKRKKYPVLVKEAGLNRLRLLTPELVKLCMK